MEADQASTTSSLSYIQFVVIVLMAIERIIKGFTASPCRHVLCKTCCTSFELDMQSPRETVTEKVNDGVNQS